MVTVNETGMHPALGLGPPQPVATNAMVIEAHSAEKAEYRMVCLFPAWVG